MAIRIPWEAHEQAVLLQALIDVLESRVERKKVISVVSKKLRKYAENRGMTIDEKFRNENGISLQMSCLEYAYTGGRSGLYRVGGWYYDIVRIYTDEKETYEKLLCEVSEVAEQNSDRRTEFHAWLEEKESDETVSAIFLSLNMLNMMLRKNSKIKHNIFDINEAEAVDDLLKRLKKNRGIRIQSKKLHALAIRGLNVYKEYVLLGSRGNKEEITAVNENHTDTLIVSFTQKGDYSYTRPVSLSYSTEEYHVKSWAALYVQVVNCILADYSDKIHSLVGKNIGSRGRVDIANNAGVSEMVAPKELKEGLYLETNCSATGIVEKIRQLMDLCSIDYSSIRIEYENKKSDSEPKDIATESGMRRRNSRNDDEFFNWLIRMEGLAVPTGRSYASAINKCNEFISNSNIGTGKLYGAETLEEIRRNIELLLADRDFQEENDAGHHRFTAALVKYQKFIGIADGMLAGQMNFIDKALAEEIDDEELSRIRATLEVPRFEYGFKDDGVELYRFRGSYREINGVDCPLEDEDLMRAIRKMGFDFDGKVYLISDDVMSSIKTEIRSYQDQGVTIIYYESLYDSKLDEYLDSKIVSSDMLKALIKNLMPELRYKKNYVALTDDKLTEVELVRNDILRVWGGSVLQTFDELYEKLPFIPPEKIRFSLSQQPAFVRNSKKTYLQAASFEADEEEISRLVDFINQKCNENGSVSLDDISFESLRIRNSELSETALVTCFYRLIDSEFDRNAKLLTKKGAGKDTYSAVLEYCRKKERCTYEALEQIADKTAGMIRAPYIIDAANEVMIRIDDDNFIADRLISFDVERIDATLDHIVTSDFIGMKEITTFSTFPFCGYGWNLYLLESYCRRFSRKYKYITRRANSSNSGAIAVKTCGLTYHDIMAHAVARSGRELSQDDVFDFLTETGYMERRRYSDIDRLIAYARELREGRE